MTNNTLQQYKIEEVPPTRIVDGLKEWDIPGYEGYSIREDMAVHSRKTRKHKHGEIKLTCQSHQLNPCISDNCTGKVSLYKERKTYVYGIGKLFLAAKLGINPEDINTNGKYVIKRDGTLTNRAKLADEARILYLEKVNRRVAYSKEELCNKLQLYRQSLDLQEEMFNTGNCEPIINFVRHNIREAMKPLPFMDKGRFKTFVEIYNNVCIDTIYAMRKTNTIRCDLLYYIAKHTKYAIDKITKESKAIIHIDNWNEIDDNEYNMYINDNEENNVALYSKP